jgi:hypothetical protein
VSVAVHGVRPAACNPRGGWIERRAADFSSSASIHQPIGAELGVLAIGHEYTVCGRASLLHGDSNGLLPCDHREEDGSCARENVRVPVIRFTGRERRERLGRPAAGRHAKQPRRQPVGEDDEAVLAPRPAARSLGGAHIVGQPVRDGHPLQSSAREERQVQAVRRKERRRSILCAPQRARVGPPAASVCSTNRSTAPARIVYNVTLCRSRCRS